MAETQAKEYIWGTGRRKSSVARVRIVQGTGKIEVNGKSLEAFFTRLDHRNMVLAPLNDTGNRTKFNVFVNVNGGGITGQAGACRLGIARALMLALPEDETLRSTLKSNEHLTRDPRMKERKKYGQKGARARFQYSKR